MRTSVLAEVRMSITGAMARDNAHLRIVRSSHKALRSFGSSFSWALSSNVVYYACQWGLLIVLAKLGTPADVGAYALGIAVTAPVLMFASFQQRTMVASDVREEYAFSEYITFRLASLASAMFIIWAVTVLTQTNSSSVAIILLVGTAQGMDYVSETYFGLLQRHGQLNRVSQSLILKGPLCLMSLGLAIWVTHNVLWGAVGLVIARGLVLILFDVPTAVRTCGPHRLVWSWRIQLRLLSTALPLGVIVGISGFTLNVPRYFIEYFLSKRELGIFSALASLVGAGNLVMAALASCIIVELAKAWVADDQRSFRSLFQRFLCVSALVGTAGIVIALLAGNKVLNVLFRPEYAGNAGVLARIMAAGALGYVVCVQGYTMTAARKLLPQIPALLGSAVVTGLSCWTLIPKRGLNGAAESWILGSLFLVVCNSFLLVILSHGRRSGQNTMLCTALERE